MVSHRPGARRGPPQPRREAGLLGGAAPGLARMPAAQEHTALAPAAMALVNEFATKPGAARVSLGLQSRGRLELRAISRTAWFDRKTQLVETIENAMEESIDQHAALAYPPAPAVRGKVIVAQRDLAARAGAAAVLTGPLPSPGHALGAPTFEPNQGAGFDLTTIELCNRSGSIVRPLLEGKLEAERWLHGR